VVFESRKQRFMDKLIDLDHFSPTVICKITLLIVDSFSFFPTVFIVFILCMCASVCMIVCQLFDE